MSSNVTVQLRTKPVVGVSECILGRKVRYNGEHKRHKFVTDVLSEHVIFEPVCPEVAIGLGVPREAVRKITIAGHTRVVGIESNTDITDQLETFSRQKAIQSKNLSGYIFMQKSPSCGVFNVKLYDENGLPTNTHEAGLYAARFMQTNPLVPVEEAGGLKDFTVRRTFITALYAYWRWQKLGTQSISPGKVIEYFAQEKYLLMAHNPALDMQIDLFLTDLSGRDWRYRADKLIELFLIGIKNPASRKKHTNVLMQLQEYWKKKLSKYENAELTRVIKEYRLGHLPLGTVLEFIRHNLQTRPDSYLQQQTYLAPFPNALGLSAGLED